jgi:hypothetical protein
VMTFLLVLVMRCSTAAAQKFTIDANDTGSRLAPPTSTPSISG